MILVIVGPTGVGKTKLSVELAKLLKAEIINGDSMQVYRELNIGTAKVTEEEKEGISHHLFDIVDPKELYTVYDYQRDCREKIKQLQEQDKNIIIVGGTGLYIKAALYDYRFNKEETHKDYSSLSKKEMIEEIHKRDESIEIDFDNKRRLVRALEKLDNESEFTSNGDIKLYNFITIGLTTDRENLYKKIDDRVDKMIKNGLIEEVKTLYDNNVKGKSINTGIGYKELYNHFDGKCSLEEAIYDIKKNSRHYAKRQYTFFNNKMDVKWFNTDYENFCNTIKNVYDYVKQCK